MPHTALPRRRVALLCLLTATSAMSARGATPLRPEVMNSLNLWHDSTLGGRVVSGDAIKNWTQASGLPNIGLATNWNPATAPLAGDDLVFGTLKAGNYAVRQDTFLSFGNISVARALASEVMSFSGGAVTANALRLTRGTVNLTTTAFNATAPGATNAESSIVVGSGAGNAATLSMAGVAGKYYDTRVGVGGATGTLTLTGLNTSLTPLSPGATPSVFGGAADAANADITLDAATVDAWIVTTGIRGSTRLSNNALLTASVAGNQEGQLQIGSPDASNVLFDASSGSDVRVSGTDALVTIGSGVGAVTQTRFQGGSSMVTDLLVTGAESSTGTASSNNTLTLAGAGTTLTATEAIGTNGLYRFTNIRRGTTTISLTGGARIFTPRFDTNAADRAADTGAVSSTSLTVSGNGSLIQARTDQGGLFVSNLGDRTTDNILVTDNGMIDAVQTVLGVGVGSNSTTTLSVNASLITGALEIARPSRAGPALSATLNIQSSSQVICTDLVTASSLTATATIAITGPGSSLDVAGTANFGGVVGEALGGGSTTFSINSGGNASFVALQAGGASAVGKSTGYTGSNIALSGLGTQLTLRGSGGETPAAGDIASNLLLATAPSTTASLTVTNGATLNLQDNNVNPNLDGAIVMAGAANTVATITVDGPEAFVSGGKLLTMAETPVANAFTNAAATINVRNGGFLGVFENETDAASGNLQMAIRPSTNSTATLNIGGGALVEDADSIVAIDGTLFVGGSGDATPVAGGRSNVNLNNGTLAAAAIAVYTNSRLTYIRGSLATDALLVRGGRVDLNATTPVVMELGSISISGGGVVNVGRGGAVVYYSTAAGSPSDLPTVRQAILNGFAGGTWAGSNGITSGLLNSTTHAYGIGYADIDAVGILSFLGVTFSPASEAVALRYTLRGDANLDGIVNFPDLLILAQNFEGSTQRDWFQGDFDYNRTVNFDDLLLLAQNYGLTMLAGGGVSADAGVAARLMSDWALARSLVPEPSTLALMAGGMLLIRRKR